MINNVLTYSLINFLILISIAKISYRLNLLFMYLNFHNSNYHLFMKQVQRDLKQILQTQTLEELKKVKDKNAVKKQPMFKSNFLIQTSSTKKSWNPI